VKIDWKSIDIKDLAGLISDTLRKDGIDTVLVGGACVSIYSQNRYMSYDLDYITYEDKSRVAKSLEKIGFREKNQCFYHQLCQFFIEFVPPPIAVGRQPIYEFEEMATSFGRIKLLKPIDCVKDRLASFYHWSDKEGLMQALEICLERSIDMKELQVWSQEEGFVEKFEQFLKMFTSREVQNGNRSYNQGQNSKPL